MEVDIPSQPTIKELNEFLVKCAARLECADKSLHTAVMILDRMKEKSIMHKYCNFTLALTILCVACKIEEEFGRNLRDFTNVGLSVIHEEQDAPKLDQIFHNIRKGLAALEFVVLREIEYNITQKRPLQYLQLYAYQLRCWMPNQIDNNIIMEFMSCLKDIYIVPQFIHDYEPEEIAIAAIAIVLCSKNIKVSGCGKKGKKEWHETLYESMSKRQLLKLQKEILSVIYKVKC